MITYKLITLDRKLLACNMTYRSGSVFTKQTLLWPGGGFTPVLGRPPCGWNNEYCSRS